MSISANAATIGSAHELHQRWLDNATLRGVSSDVVARIADECGVTPGSFDSLAGLPMLTDPDGKAFFLLPTDVGADDARRAVLMTYVFNSGTGYGVADRAGNPHNLGNSRNDYPDAPYGPAEVARIRARQRANAWSYTQDVGFVHRNGGRLVTTPNGMLMGLGGNRLQGLFSLAGGTTWGDIFLLNIDRPTDAVTVLGAVIAGGSKPITQNPDGATNSRIALERLLHHEEMHSRQWARLGYARFLNAYVWQMVRARGDGSAIPFEQQAGLSDGGYR